MSYTIVLDAGHGGKDSGAVGNGLMEKNVVLDIVMQTRNYLKDTRGVSVIMTRESDIFVELHDRCTFANNAGANLFVSIHLNSYASAAAQGFETFRAENLSGAALAETKRIQNILHTDMYRVVNGIKALPDRGQKTDAARWLRVLNDTDMPAVLLELYFISHMDAPEYTRQVDAIARGLAASIARAAGVQMVIQTPITPKQPTPSDATHWAYQRTQKLKALGLIELDHDLDSVYTKGEVNTIISKLIDLMQKG